MSWNFENAALLESFMGTIFWYFSVIVSIML